MLIIQPLRTGTFLQHLISSLIIIDIFKDVSRLTMQSAADRFECGKTDCGDFSGFHLGKIDIRHTNHC